VCVLSGSTRDPYMGFKLLALIWFLIVRSSYVFETTLYHVFETIISWSVQSVFQNISFLYVFQNISFYMFFKILAVYMFFKL
jgi:hypothetical protein